MSRVTPEVEYAAGIVSCASHAPFANREKSVHAATVVSIQRTSTTLSGGQSPEAGVWAVATTVGGTTASSDTTNDARNIRSSSGEERAESYRVAEVSSKAGGAAGACRVFVRITT